MINFNLRTTSIIQALRIENNPLFKLNKLFKSLFFGLFAICVLAFIIGLVGGSLSESILKNIAGGAILCLSLGLFFLWIYLFEYKVRNPKLKYTLTDLLARPEEINLASFVDFDLAKVCRKSQRMARRKKLDSITKELLLFNLLDLKYKEIVFIFGRAGLSFDELKAQLKLDNIVHFPKFEDIIMKAASIAQEKGKQRIGIGDVLVSFSNNDPVFEKYLVLNDLNKQDIANLAHWYERINNRLLKSKQFWTKENLFKAGSIAKDWASGYTITLDKYALDLREKVKKTGFRDIVGHTKEITQVERILEKQEINNVLLVGEPCSGRSSIVESVNQRAFEGKSSPSVNFKRVLYFDVGQLAAEIESFEELEAELDQCLAQAVKAGNTIIYIKEIHEFMSQTAKAGVMDISGILSRYLSLSSFQIIATTSYQGLHNILEKRPSLLNLFEKVEVLEISQAETLVLLENLVPFFEKKHNRFITYKALREMMELSSKYLEDIPFPEKALRLLDETMSWLVTFSKDKVLMPKHVRKMVAEKSEIPLEEIEEKEKTMLLNMEDLIHERIIDQDEAVKEISSALRRARAEIKVKQGPIGSFLFLGPTGVGKTETSKALAAIYFGSEKRMIRIDMSEFQTVKDVKRLIGSSGQEGFLTTQVKENPFSLVLLDEIEKAHPNILNIFLQVLDEGWVTDGLGRKINFKNTLIISTSNAGAEVIRQDIQENKQLDMVKEDLLDFLLKERMFRPEFINRFDSVVVFKPLSKQDLLAISQLMLNKLKGNLKDKGIELVITPELKQNIVELSYSPQFGAREMRRVIQDKVENILAQALLDGSINRGNKIEVKVENNEFKLNIL